MMSKRSLLILAALLTLVPATAFATLHVGNTAPDFSIPDTANVNHTLSQYRGKVVHLLFWMAF